ncbi:MAG: hypothetical protein AB7O91_07150 [Sphingomonas sp.]
MAGLSITNAWNETMVFMGREARLVLPVGFMLIALPGALLQAAMPVTPPNQLPEAGLWLALVPVAIAATLIGNLAISLLALRPGTSVGEAIQHGARRFLVVFAAALLVGLASMLALLPVFILAGGAAMATGNPGVAAIPVLLALPLLAFLWVRLLMLNPIGAAEPIGPVAILQRSWTLTRGHFWRLFGFLVLLLLVAIVASGAIAAIGGIFVVLLAGPPVPGSLSFYLVLILSTLVQAVLSSVFAVTIARIYLQLVPPDRSPVFT